MAGQIQQGAMKPFVLPKPLFHFARLDGFPLPLHTRDILTHVSKATLATRLFKRGPNMVGPAFTARNLPAHEDLDQLSVFENPDHPQRKSIELMPERFVIEVEYRGKTDAASGGRILMTRLELRSASGFVSDGGVRDSAPIAQQDMPVFCAGSAAPLDLARHHAVDFDIPVACGGVVISRYLADEVAADAARQEQFEVFVLELVRSGRPLAGTYPPNAGTLAEYASWKAGQKAADA